MVTNMVEKQQCSIEDNGYNLEINTISFNSEKTRNEIS